MKKAHTYVECHHCKWQLENYPDRDWAKDPCAQCKNTRKVIDPKEILCNMCGESMCPIGTHNEQYPHGLHNAKVIGGYESYHLLDMNRYTFSFCEKCLRQLFIQCKIKPDVDEMNFGGGSTEDSWEADQEAYEYRVWKDNGGHHQAYLDRKCNLVKDCPNTALYTRLYRGEFTEDCCCEEHKDRWYHSNYSSNTKFIQNMLKPFL